MDGISLKDQVRFFGGVCLKDIAERAGYTKEYLYMVMGGSRQNTRLTSAVFQALEVRKHELRKALGVTSQPTTKEKQ